MKKTLAFMVMALALLLTQCRKPSITFPTPSVTTTVSMTITAGPGSKTDINGTTGAITWSDGDKIYVGDGSKYVGCLAIQSGVGNATGTFTGDVTVDTGDDCTFHFYYLGHDNGVVLAANATKVTIDFSSQDIHADGRGNLTNASKHHVGYGKAEHVKVEADKPVTGLQVSMKSKVAIAYFRFTRVADGSDYTGALTLSGDHIYNKMTVNFSGDDFSFSGTSCIRLAGGGRVRYAMLVPAGTSAATLNFGGCVSGTTTLENGIEANKFYRIDGKDPIVVEVTPFVFSVASDTKVEFAPGNLWYDGSAFHFETNQWDTNPTAVGHTTNSSGTWSSDHVSHFYWSNTTDWQISGKEPYARDYSFSTQAMNDNFFTNATQTTANPNFHVNGETGENQWRTLNWDEWKYLLNTRTDENRFAKAKVNGVRGLLIFPDGYNGTTSGNGIAALNTKDAAYPGDNIPDDTWSSMESSGVVFFPAAGNRSVANVENIGTNGGYWSSAPSTISEAGAYRMFFQSDNVAAGHGYRYNGHAVRLVRSAS